MDRKLGRQSRITTSSFRATHDLWGVRWFVSWESMGPLRGRPRTVLEATTHLIEAAPIWERVLEGTRHRLFVLIQKPQQA
jgi:hypothetical protein